MTNSSSSFGLWTMELNRHEWLIHSKSGSVVKIGNLRLTVIAQLNRRQDCHATVK